jgi:hypothetical protein
MGKAWMAWHEDDGPALSHAWPAASNGLVFGAGWRRTGREEGMWPVACALLVDLAYVCVGVCVCLLVSVMEGE